MWTEESRGRISRIARKTKRYPSDLTDEEWERIAPLMPRPGRRGRPREVDFREVINAVRYLVRSGCGWRMLPIHFGAWQTVYGWFRELARRFLFQTIHDIELMLDRLMPPDVMRDLRVLAVAHDQAVIMSGTLRSHGDLAHNGAGGSLVRLAPQITWLFQQRIRLAWLR